MVSKISKGEASSAFDPMSLPPPASAATPASDYLPAGPPSNTETGHRRPFYLGTPSPGHLPVSSQSQVSRLISDCSPGVCIVEWDLRRRPTLPSASLMGLPSNQAPLAKQSPLRMVSPYPRSPSTSPLPLAFSAVAHSSTGARLLMSDVILALKPPPPPPPHSPSLSPPPPPRLQMPPTSQSPLQLLPPPKQPGAVEARLN